MDIVLLDMLGGDLPRQSADAVWRARRAQRG